MSDKVISGVVLLVERTLTDAFTGRWDVCVVGICIEPREAVDVV